MMNSQTFEKVAGPALILALLTLVALYVRPLTPIDESVAWEMWLRDEYLVLFKNGETYSHKPPLLFWLYNLGWAVFGINEWWPRLVSPLFSFGGLLLTLSIAGCGRMPVTAIAMRCGYLGPACCGWCFPPRRCSMSCWLSSCCWACAGC